MQDLRSDPRRSNRSAVEGVDEEDLEVSRDEDETPSLVSGLRARLAGPRRTTTARTGTGRLGADEGGAVEEPGAEEEEGEARVVLVEVDPSDWASRAGTRLLLHSDLPVTRPI